MVILHPRSEVAPREFIDSLRNSVKLLKKSRPVVGITMTMSKVEVKVTQVCQIKNLDTFFNFCIQIWRVLGIFDLRKVRNLTFKTERLLNFLNSNIQVLQILSFAVD